MHAPYISAEESCARHRCASMMLMGSRAFPRACTVKTADERSRNNSTGRSRGPYLGLQVVLDEDWTRHLREAVAASNLHKLDAGWNTSDLPSVYPFNWQYSLHAAVHWRCIHTEALVACHCPVWSVYMTSLMRNQLDVRAMQTATARRCRVRQAASTSYLSLIHI